MAQPNEHEKPTPAALRRPSTFPPGRLAVLMALGSATGVIPIPFLPSKLLSIVRGALVHDVVSRHGLTLAPDARRILSEADSHDPARAQLLRVGTFIAGRVLKRLAPLSLLSPVMSAVDIIALGVLLDRYLERVRHAQTVRIHAAESRQIRDLIDRTITRVFDRDVMVPSENRGDGAAGEDLRGDIARILDGFVLGAASVPAYLVRRLEASFDAVVLESVDMDVD